MVKRLHFNEYLDTIGDSMMALIDFLNYKFDKCTNVVDGNHYIRLYGVLSAAYINMAAILNLVHLVKIKNKSLHEDLKNSKIIFLRNAIAAHPTNFSEAADIVNYKVVRSSLNEQGRLKLIDYQNNSVQYDLVSAINEYIKLIDIILFDICTNLVRMRYGFSNEKMECLEKSLQKIKGSK
ncbi:hypothetical protein [Chondrinema litorale]|uniref:hypothetical protein n=1 Tax=Chondrinema litorale TaxID=2994555 RepID=UPI002543635C|nr:hypothetical protein [Chondrinema litorale]UZR98709.1 hypothetical protein OQ292_32385 [Chondrinema litorale]